MKIDFLVLYMKFFTLILAFICASFLLGFDVVDVLAQNNKGMVRSTDNPDAVQISTSYDGSAREGVLTIVNYFLTFVGLISVIMVIYGGFLYITSAGEDTDKAKKILLYSGVGIILILLSFALVNTILGSGNVNSGGEL